MSDRNGAGSMYDNLRKTIAAEMMLKEEENQEMAETMDKSVESAPRPLVVETIERMSALAKFWSAECDSRLHEFQYARQRLDETQIALRHATEALDEIEQNANKVNPSPGVGMGSG